MSAMEELVIGMVLVGHSDTGVVEDMNAGVNIFPVELIITVREYLGIRSQKPSISGSSLTRTSSTWKVLRHIITHL